MYSRVTFSETNSARPTYVLGVLGLVALLSSQLLQQWPELHKNLYIGAGLVVAISAIVGLQCIMGCIWHPIPKDRRADGELTTLHLEQNAEAVQSAPTFRSLDEMVAKDDEEIVDSAQAEVRDHIQWRKMACVLGLIAIEVSLLIALGN